MRLTRHQKRVLAALRALELHHDWNWWDREAIGIIVDAGGFHRIIQRGTMRVLKAAGLVQTERSSWADDVAQRIRCGCACYTWGLTPAGREVAIGLNVRWDAETVKNLACCYLRDRFHDDDDEWGRGGWRDDDDDDDRGGPSNPVSPNLDLMSV